MLLQAQARWLCWGGGDSGVKMGWREGGVWEDFKALAQKEKCVFMLSLGK